MQLALKSRLEEHKSTCVDSGDICATRGSLVLQLALKSWLEGHKVRLRGLRWRRLPKRCHRNWLGPTVGPWRGVVDVAILAALCAALTSLDVGLEGRWVWSPMPAWICEGSLPEKRRAGRPSHDRICQGRCGSIGRARCRNPHPLPPLPSERGEGPVEGHDTVGTPDRTIGFVEGGVTRH